MRKTILFSLCLLSLAVVWPTLAVVQTAIKSKTINETKTNYTIKVSYPELKGAANKELAAFVNDEVAMIKATPPVDRQSYKNELVVDYKIVKSSDIYSVVLTNYYYTGGAHGSTFKLAYIVNAKTDQRLTYKNLFNNKDLKPLIEKLRTKLAKQLETNSKLKLDTAGKTWLDEGTTNKDGNLSNVYFDGANAVWIFGQYQVAPYAYGITEVALPLTEVKLYLTAEAIKLLKIK